MNWRGLRGMTALLLALAAVVFSIGTQLEREGHQETAAEHAAEGGTSATPSATATPLQSTIPTTVAPSVRTSPTSSPQASHDAGLFAPEGSQEREAAERRRRAANRPGAVASGPSASAQVSPPKPRQPTNSATVTPNAMAPEGSAGREASEAAGSRHNATRERSELLFGINTESTQVIVSADLLAGVLIMLLLFAPGGGVLRLTGLAVLVTSAGAVALDVREGLHQYDLGRIGLVTLVVLLASLHASSAVLGGILVRSRVPASRG